MPASPIPGPPADARPEADPDPGTGPAEPRGTNPGPPAYPLLAERIRPLLAWSVLGMLLLATAVAAATLDRREWPGLIGDEAAYLMQAESLAWDLDVRYSRTDYDRFVEHWQRRPEGLILQSGDGGTTLTYGKPALYSAWLAPFVRLSPRRGPAVANALLLAAAALAAAWTLRRGAGAAAPLWVAALVFASVTFANVFWAHSDLFLACLTAIGLALVFQPLPEAPPEGEATGGRSWRPALRWAAAGALLAAVVLSRPLYAPLALPAVWAAVTQAERRRGGAGRPLAALAAGALLLAAVGIGSSWWVRGSWTPYGGERMGFYSYTGFPEVDLPDGGWATELDRRPGSGSWVEKRKLHFPMAPRLWAWDVLYFFAGSHVGVLPYFLPGILLAAAALVHRRTRRTAWPLLAAVAAVVVAFFVVRPFNFYGGGAALANRYFLPVYPALWFAVCGGAPRRPLPEQDRIFVWGAPLLATALAAPFLWPLWAAPTAYPIAAQGGWRYVSGWAGDLFPYETTLDHLKPAGREDLRHGELWIKRLDAGVAGPPEGVTEGWLRVDPPGGALLLGSRRPLERLRVETGPGGETLRFERAGKARRLVAGSRTTVWEIAPSQVARHRMWWSDETVWLYRLEIVSPVAVRLRLTPSADGRARSSPAAARR